MDARQLRYFVAIAEALSFRRASERLHVAQPALTRHLQSLESSLGVQLLHRNKHRVLLTSAGEAVLVQARLILHKLDQLPVIAQEAATGESGTLRVGFISLVAYELLPPMLRCLRTLKPRAEINLVEFLVMDQFSGILQDRMDVAILRPLYTDPAVETRVIHRAPFVVALPSGHPLRVHERVSIHDLRGEEFITLPPSKTGPSFHEQIMRFCRIGGFEPTVVRDASDSQAMMGLIAAGMGIAIVPDLTRNLRTLGVEYRPLIEITERADIVVAWRKAHNNPLITSFVEAAVENAGKPPYSPFSDTEKASPAINDSIGRHPYALSIMS
jgi:DNA-binding transcriptional LysR family regulator